MAIFVLRKLCCVRRTKIKNLKAIHNSCQSKGFNVVLCSKNKDKKSESNSQQSSSQRINGPCCVRRTKIKNLKAIHNRAATAAAFASLCSKNKDKKSESNSQLSLAQLFVNIQISFFKSDWIKKFRFSIRKFNDYVLIVNRHDCTNTNTLMDNDVSNFKDLPWSDSGFM